MRKCCKIIASQVTYNRKNISVLQPLVISSQVVFITKKKECDMNGMKDEKPVTNFNLLVAVEMSLSFVVNSNSDQPTDKDEWNK